MGSATTIVFILFFGLSLAASANMEKLDTGNEKGAREQLAKKVVKLLRDPQLATKGFVNDANLLNANDGNSFGANTAYHDYKWDYCINWLDAKTCQQWLDPYVSLHGIEGGADKSPLETLVASTWSSAGRFGLWDITQRAERQVVRRTGVKRGALDTEAIGTETADKAIQLGKTGADEGNAQVMPNIESLRTMAAVWTRTLRNRLVSNLGESRAAQRGIEYELGEDRVSCADFIANGRPLEEMPLTPGSVNLVDRDIETQLNERAQTRRQLCEQVMRYAISDVNPIVREGALQLGSPDNEAYDRAANRVNIAMIDYVGLDPNQLPKPAGVDWGDYSSELVNYDNGGVDYEKYRQTNAQTIRNYNQSLEQAKANMQGVLAAAPEFASNVDDPTRFKINMHETDLISINGLSEQMKNELKDTSATSSPIYTNTGTFSTDPDRTLPQSPSELTVIPVGN